MRYGIPAYGSGLMPPGFVTLQSLRDLVQGTWQEVAQWFVAKPRIFALPHPEQQILFEYAPRLRTAIRGAMGDANWDRLYFDASNTSLGTGSISHVIGRRPPLYIDTRRIFGLPEHGHRAITAPDIAIAVQVLRAAPALLELDDDGRPIAQRWMPTSLRLQGWLLDEHVSQLEELTPTPCDGFLFVIYNNEAGRRTTVDTRDIASWASWNQPSKSLWWASRHFRAKSSG